MSDKRPLRQRIDDAKGSIQWDVNNNYVEHDPYGAAIVQNTATIADLLGCIADALTPRTAEDVHV